jgi:hypothetical protein
MKTTKTFFALALCLSVLSVFAQPRAGMGGMGQMPSGPNLGAAMSKLFGDNQEFSADLTVQNQSGSREPVTLSGKTASLGKKTRFEMGNGGPIPASAKEQMKKMGMDMDGAVIITRPDKKITYMVFPGMQACVEGPLQDPDAAKSGDDFKLETTELGKETIDGHPCVKNKMVVTDDQGKKHESTVWNATDLKKFPVKIESTKSGSTVTMLFQNVKLAKPDASLFEPPADYKKYSDFMELAQDVMMKHMSAAPAGN